MILYESWSERSIHRLTKTTDWQNQQTDTPRMLKPQTDKTVYKMPIRVCQSVVFGGMLNARWQTDVTKKHKMCISLSLSLSLSCSASVCGLLSKEIFFF